MIQIREKNASDRDWVDGMVGHWGSDFVVSRGRKSYPQESPGFIAVDSGNKRAGLLSYEARGSAVEITLLDTVTQGKGIGGKLVRHALKAFRKKKVRRVWLVTTNNNLDAFAFYQRMGFRLKAVYPDSMEKARRIKPSIPKICVNGLPITDEIEFELRF